MKKNIYEHGLWWRENNSIVINYPADKGLRDIPKGLVVDEAMFLECSPVAIQISENTMQLRLPIRIWSDLEVLSSDTRVVETGMPLASCEQIYFVEGLADSHKMEYDEKFTIVATGTYLYQIKGMPVAKSHFKAGHEIKLKLVFIFRIGQ